MEIGYRLEVSVVDEVTEDGPFVERSRASDAEGHVSDLDASESNMSPDSRLQKRLLLAKCIQGPPTLSPVSDGTVRSPGQSFDHPYPQHWAQRLLDPRFSHFVWCFDNTSLFILLPALTNFLSTVARLLRSRVT